VGTEGICPGGAFRPFRTEKTVIIDIILRVRIGKTARFADSSCVGGHQTCLILSFREKLIHETYALMTFGVKRRKK